MVYTVTDPNGHECHSSVPYCGYSYDTLQSMAAIGCTLQIDGKKAKFPTKAEWQAATATLKKK